MEEPDELLEVKPLTLTNFHIKLHLERQTTFITVVVGSSILVGLDQSLIALLIELDLTRLLL